MNVSVSIFMTLSALTVVACRGRAIQAEPPDAVWDRPARVAQPPRPTATDELVDLLRNVLYRDAGYLGDDYEYWDSHDFEAFWAQVQGLLDRGADANLAYRRGVDLWRAVFAPDPRCRCAPYGWPGSDISKCTNPTYFRGCDKVRMANEEKRLVFVLAHGLDPNLKASGTPLCRVVNAGTLNSVKLLLQHGATCAQDCFGESVMHSAARLSDGRLCLLLKSCGTGLINVQGDDGRSPLMGAGVLGLKENVAILLDYGADPTIKDREGHDLIRLTRRYHKPAVADLLARWKMRGADGATHTVCGP